MATARTLVCPKCSAEGLYLLSVGMTGCTCAACKKQFDCLVATVRAKRSRGDKKGGTREYSIRVLIGQDERLIEFDSNSYYDFEMRSGDDAAFLYRKDAVYVVHNFTIGRYRRINKDFNFVPLLVFAAFAAAIIVYGYVMNGR
jgi:hypothetical protein